MVTRAPAGERDRDAPDLLTVTLGALALLGAGFLALPLAGLLLRAPWTELGGQMATPEVGQALWISLVTSLGALLLATVVGVPLAWVLARKDFRGKVLVRSLCLLPMVLPPVVGGVALLLAFGRRGIVGAPLYELVGVSLPFSSLGVVLAQAFVAMPFLVVTVEAGLRSIDPRYEGVAASLGAGGWTTFRRVTLPLLSPALLAGMGLAWARALGEFGATITFAGNLPGRTQTMPLAVYVELQTRPEVAILLSLILLAVSGAVLVAAHGRILRPA